jgi:hypothetical protein
VSFMLMARRVEQNKVRFCIVFSKYFKIMCEV